MKGEVPRIESVLIKDEVSNKGTNAHHVSRQFQSQYIISLSGE